MVTNYEVTTIIAYDSQGWWYLAKKFKGLKNL